MEFQLFTKVAIADAPIKNIERGTTQIRFLKTTDEILGMNDDFGA